MKVSETILSPEAATGTHGRAIPGVVSPPDGFRMLVEGERTKRGDVFCMFGKWMPAKGYNAKWNQHRYWPMARRVAAQANRPEAT
jgi:hypothetical protein